MYSIHQDDCFYTEMQDINQAINLTRELLGGVEDGEYTTFTVKSTDDLLMSSVTNRRIIGTFLKEQWAGDSDYAIPMGEDEFDATNFILLMELSEINALKDNRNTDDIGLSHVEWDGPFSVRIVDAISLYFGVSDVSEITHEALMFCRDEVKPQPPRSEVIKLSVEVSVNLTGGATLEEFVRNMNCKVQSETPGAIVHSVTTRQLT